MDFDEEDAIGPYTFISEPLATSSEKEEQNRGAGGSVPRKRVNIVLSRFHVYSRGAHHVSTCALMKRLALFHF